MKYLKLASLSAVILFSQKINAQLEVKAEIRPRFEFRRGYKDLYKDNVDPASYVSQRTRLTTGYNNEKLDVFVSLQNVRVWGDVSQLNNGDVNGIAVQQAWSNIKLNNAFSVKLGRQEIVLDDHRIFGSVNWTQQARSHDAVVFKYKNDSNKTKLDFGVAYNQNGAAGTGNTYTVAKNYKAMQYLWFHKDWKRLSMSLLALNNGLQFIDTSSAADHKLRYSQTVGTHVKYKSGKLAMVGNAFYQFGKDVNDNNLNSYLVGLQATYNLKKSFNLTLGGEIQSGNDGGVASEGDNNAFSPFYGTNHKFNGLMDYFYVGNHGNNVGLVDIYLKTKIGINAKSKVVLAVHNFSSAAKLPVEGQAQLGTEADLVYVYKVNKSVLFKAGFSQMFASEGMKELKNNYTNNSNNWGWAMLIVKPTIFTNKK